MYMYPNNSSLNRWLCQNKYKTSPKDGSIKRSHLLLNGGNIFLPHEEYKNFLKLYSRDIILGVKHYISEVRTPIFNLFFDVDYYDYHELSLESIKQLCRDIQYVISKFFEDQLDTYQRRLIVSVCDDTKKYEQNGKILLKTGLHLHWPSIQLDKSQAFIIRSAILQYLENKNGVRGEGKLSWNEVIDESVFKGSGLRLIGTRKCSKCSDCKNKKPQKDNCITCTSLGKTDDGRVYKFKFVLDGFNNEDMLLQKKFNNNFYELIKECSIRTNQEQPNISIINYPEWYEMNKYMPSKKGRKKKNNTENIKKNHSENFEEHSELKFRKKINPDDIRFQKLTDFLSLWLPKEYNQEFTDLYLCGDKEDFYVLNTKDHYCMNKKDEHSSNHIYYLITKEEIFQKCFSENISEFSNLKCSEFKYKIIKISERIKKLLYPNDYENMNTKYKINVKTIKGIYGKSKINKFKNTCKYLDLIEKRILNKKKNF